jgi:uncharacterized protein with PQ loop repeat
MDLLSTLYVAAGIVFAMAFVPQIMRLIRDTTGAASLSLSAWAMFSACNAVTLLYAVFHNGNPYFILCTALCTAGNMAVFTLASVRRLALIRSRR